MEAVARMSLIVRPLMTIELRLCNGAVLDENAGFGDYQVQMLPHKAAGGYDFLKCTSGKIDWPVDISKMLIRALGPDIIIR